MDNEQLQQFLARIAQIESAGGKNVQHPTMKSGMHQGMHAIGKYGLMPLTIQDLSKNSTDPEISGLKNQDQESIQRALASRPEIEDVLAEQLARKVLERQGGNELKAAYSWNQGHNLSPQQIPTDKLEKSPYVQKYQKLSSNPSTAPATPDQRPNLAHQELQSMSPEDMDMMESYLNSLDQSQPEETELRKPLEDESDNTAQVDALKKFLG